MSKRRRTAAHWAARLAIAFGAAAPAAAGAQVLEIAPDGSVSRLGWAAPESDPATPPCAQGALKPAFEDAARRYELSVELLANVARAESNCSPRAVSSAGAIGVMQLMPDTARELGVDPWNPAENIRGGTAYLRRQLDRFDSRLDLALAAYNAGPEAVAQRGAVPAYAETRAYVARNLDFLAQQSLGQSGTTW